MTPKTYTPSPAVFAWYALRVKARSEIQVAATLGAKGIETYVPLCKTSKKWADRVKVSQTPLFPGYVFSRFNVNNRLPILVTPNVIQVLGIGKTPVSIPDSEIENLFLVGAADVPKSSVNMPDAGEKIFIRKGPLAGVEGILIRANRGSRLLVNVTILRRAVAVEIEQSWVSGVIADRHFEQGAAA
jgi:transcription antitermination factor NusG